MATHAEIPYNLYICIWNLYLYLLVLEIEYLFQLIAASRLASYVFAHSIVDESVCVCVFVSKMTNLLHKWKFNLEICDKTRAHMTTTLTLIEKRALYVRSLCVRAMHLHWSLKHKTIHLLDPFPFLRQLLCHNAHDPKRQTCKINCTT